MALVYFYFWQLNQLVDVKT